MDFDKKWELIQEYNQEQKEEELNIWIEDNLESLQSEFCLMQEGEFREYCENEFYASKK